MKTLQEAVKMIGDDALAVQADVANPGELDKLYASVSQKLGKIDVLFVNAGIYKFVPLAATTEDLYDELFDINTKGAYFTIQKALPFLNDGASIILNTSVADEIGLVNDVCPHDELLDRTHELAQAIRAHDQAVVRRQVSLYRRANGIAFDDALVLERQAADEWREARGS